MNQCSRPQSRRLLVSGDDDRLLRRESAAPGTGLSCSIVACLPFMLHLSRSVTRYGVLQSYLKSLMQRALPRMCALG